MASGTSGAQNVSLFYEMAVDRKGRKVNLTSVSPVWINIQTAEVLENASTMIRVPDEIKARREFELICPKEQSKTARRKARQADEEAMSLKVQEVRFSKLKKRKK